MSAANRGDGISEMVVLQATEGLQLSLCRSGYLLSVSFSSRICAHLARETNKFYKISSVFLRVKIFLDNSSG